MGAEQSLYVCLICTFGSWVNVAQGAQDRRSKMSSCVGWGHSMC